jgi:hypothetical protein
LGHRHSLTDRVERAELWAIICDEVRHRTCLLDMLSELGTVPDPARERKMERVGRAISRFCQVGGWFFPMYGAGRLESQNIREYELAARLAHVAELRRFVAPFLEMAEVEWDHERYFKSKAAPPPLAPHPELARSAAARGDQGFLPRIRDDCSVGGSRGAAPLAGALRARSRG